jgi:hypothetical protein
MWTDEQRQRYTLLREREQASMLTAEERAELMELMQALNDREAVYLAPANKRKAQEVTTMAAAVEQLEMQNRRLREYLRERQTFLARVKSLVADLHAEDRHIRERYADVLTLIGASPTHKAS